MIVSGVFFKDEITFDQHFLYPASTFLDIKLCDLI